MTHWHEIDGNNAGLTGGGDASQRQVAFLFGVPVLSDVYEFLLCRGRENDLGRSETLTYRRERVQDGFGLFAQIHDDIGVNGDERAGGDWHQSRVS